MPVCTSATVRTDYMNESYQPVPDDVWVAEVLEETVLQKDKASVVLQQSRHRISIARVLHYPVPHFLERTKHAQTHM